MCHGNTFNRSEVFVPFLTVLALTDLVSDILHVVQSLVERFREKWRMIISEGGGL